MTSSLRLTGVSLALFAGLGLSAHAAEPRVVLGVAVPLSGPLAASGQDAVNGVQMALNQLNAEHARIGGKTVRWAMDAEDPGPAHSSHTGGAEAGG
ncbi:Putative ABC-type branched-chain amino acid transport systems, periplasmic component (fragment) [Thiomonas sp. CB2]